MDNKNKEWVCYKVWQRKAVIKVQQSKNDKDKNEERAYILLNSVVFFFTFFFNSCYTTFIWYLLIVHCFLISMLYFFFFESFDHSGGVYQLLHPVCGQSHQDCKTKAAKLKCFETDFKIVEQWRTQPSITENNGDSAITTRQFTVKTRHQQFVRVRVWFAGNNGADGALYRLKSTLGYFWSQTSEIDKFGTELLPNWTNY